MISRTWCNFPPQNEEVRFIENELENHKQKYFELQTFTRSLILAIKSDDKEQQQVNLEVSVTEGVCHSVLCHSLDFVHSAQRLRFWLGQNILQTKKSWTLNKGRSCNLDRRWQGQRSVTLIKGQAEHRSAQRDWDLSVGRSQMWDLGKKPGFCSFTALHLMHSTAFNAWVDRALDE